MAITRDLEKRIEQLELEQNYLKKENLEQNKSIAKILTMIYVYFYNKSQIIKDLE